MANIQIERGIIAPAGHSRIGYDTTADGSGVLMTIEHEDIRLRAHLTPEEAERCGASILKLCGILMALQARRQQPSVVSPVIVRPAEGGRVF